MLSDLYRIDWVKFEEEWPDVFSLVCQTAFPMDGSGDVLVPAEPERIIAADGLTYWAYGITRAYGPDAEP